MSTLKLSNIVSQQGTGNVAVSLGTNDQVTFTHAVSQPGGFTLRNKIINGNFDIWQRATSQTSSGYGSVDRWQPLHTGSTKTASRQSFTLGQTDVPGEPTYFMRHVVTSVAGSGNYVGLTQTIESVRTLAGKTATLSFWAKADSNKNIAVEFRQNFGTGGSPSTGVDGIGSQLVSLTTSWAKYTVTTSIPSITGKTLGTNSNDWLAIQFWFDAGSTYNSRTVSLGQQSGTFDIAEVQLEEGSVATTFEERPLAVEVPLCLRYYQVVSLTMQSPATGNFVSPIQFSVPMRATPSLTNSGGSNNNVSDYSLSVRSTATGICPRITASASNGFRDTWDILCSSEI
jgi:hypothetical protein